MWRMLVALLGIAVFSGGERIEVRLEESGRAIVTFTHPASNSGEELTAMGAFQTLDESALKRIADPAGLSKQGFKGDASLIPFCFTLPSKADDAAAGKWLADVKSASAAARRAGWKTVRVDCGGAAFDLVEADGAGAPAPIATVTLAADGSGAVSIPFASGGIDGALAALRAAPSTIALSVPREMSPATLARCAKALADGGVKSLVLRD